MRVGIRRAMLGMAALAMLGLAAPLVRAGGGGLGGNGNNNNARTTQQRLLARVQTNVYIPEEEWVVIAPKLWQVTALQAAIGGDQLGRTASQLTRTGAQGGRGGGGGGGGAQVITDIPPAVTAMATDLRQKETELAAVAANPNSTDAQIQIKLREYRASRDRVLEALHAARADLIRILTLRQEAMILLDGFLE